MIFTDRTRRLWQDAAFRAKRAATFALPEVQEKRRQGMKAAWQRPDVLERRAATNALPETQARRSAGASAAWADPGLCSEQSERRLGWLSDPENYAATVATNREINSRPEVRQKLSEAISSLIWINDGVACRRIPYDAPIPDGWQAGRLGSYGPKPGTIKCWRITDGTNNRIINQGDPIPDGWRRGMTHKRLRVGKIRSVNDNSAPRAPFTDNAVRI